MSEFHKLPPGAVFELDGQWYVRVGEKSVQPISLEDASRRRAAQLTPRTALVDKPTNTGQSTNATAGLSGYSHRDRHASDTRAAAKRETPVEASKPRDASRRPSEPPVVVPNSYKSQSSGVTRYAGSEEAIVAGISGMRVTDTKPQAATKIRHESKSSQEDFKTPSVGEADSRNPAASSTDFKILTGLPRYFVSIPEKDYTKRAEFLTEFPELLKTNLKNLYVEAVHQVSKNQYELARQCISSMVIIRQCENLRSHPERIEDRLDALNDSRTERYRSYWEMFAAVEEDVNGAVKKQDPVTKTKAKNIDDQTLTSSTRHKEHEGSQRGPSKPPPIDPITEIETMTAKSRTLSTEALLNDIGEHLSAVISDVADKTPAAIQISPGDLDDSSLRTLSSQYRVYERASTFFIPGRVFSVLWHDPAGRAYKAKSKGAIDELTEPHPHDGYLSAKLARNTTVGPYGEKIYSHIRRMIVIRSRTAYCWCIAIGTYGGQAMKKRGLKKADIDSHAIVYDSRLKPEYLPNEPETSKMPIAVRLRQGQTLSESSRLHYGKPITIEFNQPVLDCGMVVKEHLPFLLSEVRSEMLDGLPQVPTQGQ